MLTDRELDALIAQRIMGTEIPTWLDLSIDTLTGRDIVPCYAADIAAAWQAADTLADETGCRIELIRNFWLGSAWPRYVAFVRGGDLAYPSPSISVSARDDSPARTLCLALLKAKGIEL